MTDLEFDLPKNSSNIIKVLGVGGGGSNAVSYMYSQGIKDVDFIVCNTDAQVLELCPVPNKIQLGKKGLGAGSIPDVGREATRENIEQIKDLLKVNTKMLFITAGMGGGTGTGGAPVIAQAARELNILTVGIVTIPFLFEGRKRRQQAEAGIEEMRKYVDTLLLVNNDKLRELYGDLKLSEAFHRADNILTTAARGIAELITMPGYVNVDFEDVKTVMKNSGKAIMGSEMAEGENRALKAVEGALNSPLLNDNTIKGADNILLYINSGTEEVSLDEVSEITDYIQKEAGQNAEILWGNGTDEKLGAKICVTIVATGFDSKKKETPPGDNKVFTPLYSNDNTPKDNGHNTSGSNDSQEIIMISRKTEEKAENIEKLNDNGFNPEPKKSTTQPLFSDNAKDPVLTKPQQNVEPTQIPEKEKIFTSVRKIIADQLPFSEYDGNAQSHKQAEERIKRLKDMSLKIKTPAGLSEVEKEPAYIRKNFEIKDPPPNKGQQNSRRTISNDEDNNTDIRNNNPYLHDNVD